MLGIPACSSDFNWLQLSLHIQCIFPSSVHGQEAGCEVHAVAKDPFDCNAALNNFFRALWCQNGPKGSEKVLDNWIFAPSWTHTHNHKLYVALQNFRPLATWNCACQYCLHLFALLRHGHQTRSTGAAQSLAKAAKDQAHLLWTLAMAWFGSVFRPWIWANRCCNVRLSFSKWGSRPQDGPHVSVRQWVVLILIVLSDLVFNWNSAAIF